MNVATAISDVLAAEGISAIFGVPASETMEIVVAAATRGIDTYHARHEQAALGMADGYARISGRVGVAVVGRGPGFTNGLNAMITACKARTPLLVIAGELPSTVAGDPEASARHVLAMKNVDQRGIATALGMTHLSISSADAACSETAAALAAAREGVTVLLTVPTDIARAKARAGGPKLGVADLDHSVLEPGAADIAAVADLLQEGWTAHRPVILAGRGARDAAARSQLSALGETIGALLANSLQAKGSFAGAEFDIGTVGTLATPVATELSIGCDLLLAFGASLNPFTTYGGDLFKGARVIQFDTDEGAFGRYLHADVCIQADAGRSAAMLASELARRGHRAAGYRSQATRAVLSRLRNPPASPDLGPDGALHPAALMAALDTALPADRLVIVDAGAHMSFAASGLSVPDPQSFMTTTVDYASVGSAHGVAMGAALAAPGRTTVLVIGDGGMMMSLPDLQTAARYQLPLVIVVCNDCAFGQEVQILRMSGLPDDIARYPAVQFAALARDVGVEAITVDSPAALSSMRERLTSRGGPLLVDCRVSGLVWGEHTGLVSRLGR